MLVRSIESFFAAIGYEIYWKLVNVMLQSANVLKPRIKALPT